MKRTGNSVYCKLFLLVLLGASQIASVASAQTARLRGTFHLRTEAHWGTAVLPAGSYSVTIEEAKNGTLFAVARSQDGKRSAVAIVTGSGQAEKGGSFLFIANDGTRGVRLLNLPEENLSLSFGPLTKRDREQMYAMGNEVAPVEVARK